VRRFLCYPAPDCREDPREVPQLFDPVKVERALQRALRAGPATFLLERASDDLIERLDPVLRDFDPMLDLGTPGAQFGAVLRRAGKARTIEHRGEIGAFIPEISSLPLRWPDLGLEPGRYGLIASGLVMQRVNDVPGFLAQARRALKMGFSSRPSWAATAFTNCAIASSAPKAR
jgi:hypothetical protein